MAGRPRTRAKQARKAHAKKRYENAGDYIRFKAARSKTYGPVRPGLQPRWMGLKPAKASKRSASSASASRRPSAKASSPGCSTRGYNPTRELTKYNDLPASVAARHLRTMPSFIREGHHHLTIYRGDEVITFCRNGRLDSLVQGADGSDS